MRYTFYVTIVTKLLSVKVSINSKTFLFDLSHVRLIFELTFLLLIAQEREGD